MVKCICRDRLEALGVFMLESDKEIEKIAGEDERKIVALKTKILIDLNFKLSDWALCNCYAAIPLRKVKEILEYNLATYEDDAISFNDLHQQYSIIKQTLRTPV